MRYNRFFNIDSLSSASGSELMFKYKRVKIERNGITIYPIYLVFKPFEVEINYCGPSYSKLQNDESNILTELVNRRLFSLSLSEDYTVNRMLEKELKKIWDDSLDLSVFNNDIIKSRECKDGHNKYKLSIDSKDIFASKEFVGKKEHDENIQISYNSIPSNEYSEYLKEDEGIIRYRTIFLDLIYDIVEIEKRFTDFTHYSYYDEVKQRLMSNQFFFSICMMYSYKYRYQSLQDELNRCKINKSLVVREIKRIKRLSVIQNFRKDVNQILSRSSRLSFTQKTELIQVFDKYQASELAEPFIQSLERNTNSSVFWQKELMEEFLKTSLFNCIDSSIKISLILVSELSKAHNNWISALSRENADTIITKDNKWFSDIEQEYEIVFGIEKHYNEKLRLQIPYLVKNIFDFSLRRRRQFTVIQKLKELSAFINMSHLEYFGDESIKLDRAARWFLERYNITNAFKLYSIGFTILIKIFVIGVLFLTSATLLTLLNNEFFPHLNDYLLYANISGLAIFFTIIFAAISKTILSSTANQIREKYNTNLWYFSLFWIKHRFNRVSIRIIGFFMPKLLMAIISGWIILLTAEEIWKSVFDLPLRSSLWVAISLLLVMFIYISIDMQKIKPRISSIEIFKRTVVLIAFGIFYSNIIGLITISLSSERMLARSDYMYNYFSEIVDDNKKTAQVLHFFSHRQDSDAIQSNKDTLAAYVRTIIQQRDSIKYYKDSELQQYLDHLVFVDGSKSMLVYRPDGFLNRLSFLRVFPGMLIFNTVIALFIGLFIHLLFNRRNIAEPL